jgi:hypothetical protein
MCACSAALPVLTCGIRPGPVCPACLSEDWTWDRVGGTGRAVAWTTFHRAYFKEIPVPHTVVSAALAEGPLLVADYGGDPAALRLDAPFASGGS